MTGIEELRSSGNADADELRCPSCGSLKWYRDGLWIHGTPSGGVVCQRLKPARGGDVPWSCSSCGETVFTFMRLHVRLEEVASADEPSAAGRAQA